jgi:hypothetical protein
VPGNFSTDLRLTHPVLTRARETSSIARACAARSSDPACSCVGAVRLWPSAVGLVCMVQLRATWGAGPSSICSMKCTSCIGWGWAHGPALFLLLSADQVDFRVLHSFRAGLGAWPSVEPEGARGAQEHLMDTAIGVARTSYLLLTDPEPAIMIKGVE